MTTGPQEIVDGCDDCSDLYLRVELEAFEKMRSRLVQDHPGQFAVIHAGDLIGVFHSEIEADRQGSERLGDSDFLIGRCVPKDDDFYEVGLILA